MLESACIRSSYDTIRWLCSFGIRIKKSVYKHSWYYDQIVKVLDEHAKEIIEEE